MGLELRLFGGTELPLASMGLEFGQYLEPTRCLSVSAAEVPATVMMAFEARISMGYLRSGCIAPTKASAIHQDLVSNKEDSP